MLIEDRKLLEKVFAAWKSQKPILVHAEGDQLKMAINLAEKFNKRLHVCHISQAVEVEMVAKAKAKGLAITAGVTPHHLFLLTGEVMKPPLGSRIDQKALWQGLKKGTIDLIESDHAPHALDEKKGKTPAFGVPGLETTLGLMLLAVKQKKVELADVKKWLYNNPRKIFNIPAQKSRLEFDPDLAYTLKEADLKTKCGWSPFNNWTLYGKPLLRS
jgi:dihydroorotase-like cyclic amidohydrolase